MYVCIYLLTYVWMYVHIFKYMYACVRVCVCLCGQDMHEDDEAFTQTGSIHITTGQANGDSVCGMRVSFRASARASPNCAHLAVGVCSRRRNTCACTCVLINLLLCCWQLLESFGGSEEAQESGSEASRSSDQNAQGPAPLMMSTELARALSRRRRKGDKRSQSKASQVKKRDLSQLLARFT